MKTHLYIYIATAIALLTIIIYVVCFYNAPLSNRTSDWGAFGSYISICISVISIALIYITYNEQKQSNRIERFEQHLKSMTDTLSQLMERNRTTLENDYRTFSSHFIDPFHDISSYEKKVAEYVCVYYFSGIIYERVNEYKHLFNYMDLTINYIKRDYIQKKEDKYGRIMELSCVLPKSLRTFYFCWLIQQEKRQLLEYCYANDLFLADEPNDNLLSDIIRLICTGNKPKKYNTIPIDINNIDLGNYDNEKFDETYNRLSNNKKEKL